MKTCTKCDIEKSLDDFSKHPNTLDRRQSQCKLCANEYRTKWNQDNSEERNARARASRQERMRILRLESGNKCKRCDYDEYTEILMFHHRDPATKEFGVAVAATRTKGMDECRGEADKCDLLCPNCHAVVHYIDRQRKDN